jgi:hypothetical protein
MSQQTDLDATAIVARYLAVWNEVDAEARRAAIPALWVPDGTEFVHEVQFRGYAELEARVDRAHQAFVANGKYTVAGAGDVTRHDDIVTFTAQLVTSAGEVDWASRVFLLLDADGRIREDYQLTVKPLPA